MTRTHQPTPPHRRVLAAGLLVTGTGILISCTLAPTYLRPSISPDDLNLFSGRSSSQLRRRARTRTEGCVSCHVGQTDPHPFPHAKQRIFFYDLPYNKERAGKPGRFAHVTGCVDCHGGDASIAVDRGATPDSPGYRSKVEAAHVQPAHPEAWYGQREDRSANPERSYDLTLRESWDFIRFVNPSDLRVASMTCGSNGCHGGQDERGHMRVHADTGRRDLRDNIVLKVRKSMMTHGALLWGAALYNNGAYPSKRYRFGESYSADGKPQRVYTHPDDLEEGDFDRGVLPFLDPLPRFEISQPSNILRIFERGQRKPLLIGLPTPGIPGTGLDEEPGRPTNRLSQRGYGTLNRTDPVWLNLQRTRLMDPTLNMMGTNDGPGDYRSSGCASCHMVYANDRDPLSVLRGNSLGSNSGPYARYGNSGTRAEGPLLDDTSYRHDPTIPTGKPGHPLAHMWTRRIPSSQCVTCHMHPGTAVSNTYLGYTWWDLETDGEHMWPTTQINPTIEEQRKAYEANPEGSTPKGLWNAALEPSPGDPVAQDLARVGVKTGKEFLGQTGSAQFNERLQSMQMGDFHGHGFPFRAVWKKDIKGNLLDAEGEVVSPDDPDKWKKSVHLKDIHLEKGMHCVDCHFEVDNHGDGKLYGEFRAATAIECQDCHGTIYEKATLTTSGNSGGQDMSGLLTPFGEKRFEILGAGAVARYIQRSMVTSGLTWDLVQTRDTVNPKHPRYNGLSAKAKTMKTSLGEWGYPDPNRKSIAHDRLSCYACHTSWMASCFGCHLPMQANQRRDALHFEGETQRNWSSYSWQTIRDDVFMLGIDGSITAGDREIVPVRSACAVMVGSQNQNREWVYSQQQTVSAEGFSGTAFSPHFPHTVRTVETKFCNDCHLTTGEVLEVPGSGGGSGDDDEFEDDDDEFEDDEDDEFEDDDDEFEDDDDEFEDDEDDEFEDDEDGQPSAPDPSTVIQNNATVAQLLMLGTNLANFIGRYCYVAEGAGGLEAVVVGERNEPQAVIGSRLHQLAYPDDFNTHVKLDRQLTSAVHHPANTAAGVSTGFGSDEVLSIQLRGEYLYTANGTGGLRCYDVGQIDQKGFSARIVWAPVSPLGQQLAVPSSYATSVKAPTTQAVDPARNRDPANQEQPIHLSYAFLYVTDLEEGLILVFAGTLLDGNPDNNFLSRQGLWVPSQREASAGGSDDAETPELTGIRASALAASGPGQVLVTGRVPNFDELKAPVSVRVNGQSADVSQADGHFTVNVGDDGGRVRVELSDADGGSARVELSRVDAFNPGGILKGARSCTVSGHYVLVCCERTGGLVAISVEDPENPRLVMASPEFAELGSLYPELQIEPRLAELESPRAIEVQFRTALVCDAEGVKALNVKIPLGGESSNSLQLTPIPGAVLPLDQANGVYFSRTYAFIAAGKDGLVIVDLMDPSAIADPANRVSAEAFPDNAKITDARDVKVGMTNSSIYAYVADGVNGLRVVQLTSPEGPTPGFHGFSPTMVPKLIATWPTRGPALAISEGIDRDRAVDESGNQISVFGRLGSRPLGAARLKKMRDYETGIHPRGAAARKQRGPLDFATGDYAEESSGGDGDDEGFGDDDDDEFEDDEDDEFED